MPKNIVVFSDGTGQDGGARPEQRISNVYKMYRASRVGPDTGIDPATQVSFYDPGLGTDIGSTALTAPMRTFQKLMGSIDGRGITRNIAECYAFIINHYEDSDRIFLIGFSRGAYTVRCLANLLRLCGIPTKTPAGGLPTFRQAIGDIAKEAVDGVLEHGAGFPREKYEDEREEQARRFRKRYGSHHPSGEALRSNAAPYFVGVFDTVAALGASGAKRLVTQAILGVVGLGLASVTALAALVPAAIIAALLAYYDVAWFGRALVATDLAIVVAAVAIASVKHVLSYRKVIRDYPNPGDKSVHYAVWKGANFDRLLSRFVSYARSANAIDETRADFKRVAWGGRDAGAPDQVAGHPHLLQVWFAGNHSDIGGSYAETESRLSDIALDWMLEQATAIPNGLIVDRDKPEPNETLGKPKLRTWPSADGVQHCEVLAMNDAIEGRTPRGLKWLTRRWGWPVAIRPIDPKAAVDPSVDRRSAMSSVPQAAGAGPYRPEALRQHERFKHLYGGDHPAESRHENGRDA